MYTLNAVKLRNAILAADPKAKVELKNVRINGVLQGCSGFVLRNGRVVYVDTDRNHGTNKTALVRTARHTRDYTGGPNTFAEYDVDAVVQRILELSAAPTVQDMDDEEDAPWDAMIASGRLKVVHVKL